MASSGAAIGVGRWYRVDLRGMLARCESNYARLMRLLHLMAEGEEQLSVPLHASGHRALRLTVEQTCPYTTMLHLRLTALHDSLPAPAMRVRLYHDARMAEVTEAEPFRRVQARYDYPNPAMHQRDEKHQWNLFLSDWLAHVQEHGLHSEPVWPAASGNAR